jgi:hypothetical protein
VEQKNEESESVPFLVHLHQSLVREKATLLSLFILLLIATILYLSSTWSALHLSHAARTLAQTARDVVKQGGNDDQLQKEILLKLEQLQHRDDLSEAALHLAIAFVVAIVIIITVEIYSSRRTHREINQYRDSIAREVWSALSGRLVPPTIVDEIQGILKAQAIKENVSYTLTFMRYEGLPSNAIVLQRKLAYTVRNLTRRRISHPIRSMIQNVRQDVTCHTKAGVTLTLPRHVELRVDGVVVPLSEDAKTLQKNSQGQLRNLVYDVDLGKTKDRAEVYIFTEEQLLIGGENHYLQLVPVTGLTVTVENKLEDVIKVRDVQLGHPNWSEFVPGADGVYRYNGAVLPGQGIAISWEPV